MVRSLSGDQRRAAEEMARYAHEFASQPVRNLCLYYVLYYLSEIEQVEAAHYDWQTHRDLLYRGMHDYATYAVATEVTHFVGAYFQYGVDVGAPGNDLDPVTVADEIMHRAGIPARTADGLIQLIDATEHDDLHVSPAGPVGRYDLESDIEEYERHGYIASEPRNFQTAARALFASGQSLIMDYEEQDRTGWLNAYGGDAWAVVCRWLLRRGDVPDTVWIDSGWGIEHNGETFLDRVSTSPRDHHALERFLGFGMEKENAFLTGGLDQLLDAGREDRLRVLGELALEWNADLGFNLRRYLDRLPGEAGTLAPEERFRKPTSGGGSGDSVDDDDEELTEGERAVEELIDEDDEEDSEQSDLGGWT